VVNFNTKLLKINLLLRAELSRNLLKFRNNWTIIKLYVKKYKEVKQK